jgi:spore coat polysaccharide biosynthesis protein SpsF
MKTTAVIQARMGSSRLPGKVLKPILGRPMLGHIVRRVRAVPAIDEVVVAVPDDAANEELRQFCKRDGITVFAGSENNVLDRFYKAARLHNADPVLRITADCPLVDPALIGRLISTYEAGGYDYFAVAAGADACRLESGRFPDGLDTECFSFAALEQAWQEATDPRDREHVTRFIWRQKDRFQCGQLYSEADYGHLRLTVDHPDDFALVEKIYEELYDPNRIFLLPEVVELLNRNGELGKLNSQFAHSDHYRAVIED